MNWFDIIKVLGTKSGYAQLDFDNIVEEEDDSCRKEWQRMCNRVEKAIKEVDLRTLLDDDIDYEFVENPKPSFPMAYVGVKGYDKYARGGGGFDNKLFYEGFRAAIGGTWGYNPEIPEEVYCAALDMLKAAIRGDGKRREIRFGIYAVSGELTRYEIVNDFEKEYSVTIYNGETEKIIEISFRALTGKKLEKDLDKLFDAVLGKLK